MATSAHHYQHILQWLDTLASSTSQSEPGSTGASPCVDSRSDGAHTQAHSLSKKRKRSPELPPSPKSLPAPMYPLPPVKKTRVDAIHDQSLPESDNDATPRKPDQTPAPALNWMAASAPLHVIHGGQEDERSIAALSISTNASSASGTSRKRGRQSPTKQLRMLAADDICEELDFYGDKRSPSHQLLILNDRLKSMGRGRGILPQGPLAQSILDRARRDRSFQTLDPHSSICLTGSRDALGSTPTPDVVQEIWEEAAICRHFHHEEARWNMMHNDVFKIALSRRGRPQKSEHYVDWTVCTTAQVVKSYLPSVRLQSSATSSTTNDPFRDAASVGTPSRTPRESQHNQQQHHPGKRIDFCVFVNAEEMAATNNLAKNSPHGSVNHTDFSALTHCPIALSVETKPVDRWNEALTQMSIWQVAHWNRLDELVKVAAQRQCEMVNPATGTSGLGAAAASGLDFLPSIIVQGHEWHFLASERPSGLSTQNSARQSQERMGRIIMYNKTFIGSTATIEGIYSLVANIQLLATWVEDDFWPWYKRAVLGAE